MKIKILVAASTLLASGIVLAAPYQYDVGAEVVRTDLDGLNSETNKYGLTGAYYFDAVKTSNVPLAEAAFLGKNSNVHAGVSNLSRPGPNLNSYEVGAEFFIPENFLYVDAGVKQARTKGNTDNDWYTTLGLTPIDGLLVTTSYAHDEGYDANIRAKYVAPLLGAGEFINVEAAFRDGDGYTYKELAGDYYLDTTFSVGGIIRNAHSDTSFGVRARKFFTEEISADASYEDTPDGNVVTVGANIRF